MKLTVILIRYDLCSVDVFNIIFAGVSVRAKKNTDILFTKHSAQNAQLLLHSNKFIVTTKNTEHNQDLWINVWDWDSAPRKQRIYAKNKRLKFFRNENKQDKQNKGFDSHWLAFFLGEKISIWSKKKWL